MSRRPNPAAERTAVNQQTLKTLIKLESNKVCADCKKNKHPRWASWNLGIFVCIRCSGIHRGMGTHISKVKSVDLDSWTDEQVQSVIRWGNSRANKYWESKLAPNHVPSEAKIENFIRTKYESKRWVMEGPMPDPETLGGDNEERPNAQAAPPQDKPGTRTFGATGSKQKAPEASRQQNVDLFGEYPSVTAPTSSGSTGIAKRTVPSKADAAPPRSTKPGDSLLGLDFFGGTQSSNLAHGSGAAAASTGSGASRPDLKQSILSLYSSNSAPTQPPNQPQHQSRDSFSGSFSDFQTASQSPQQKPSGFASLTDAFGGLGVGASAQKPGVKATTTSKQQPNYSSGSFFDTLPSPTNSKKPAAVTNALEGFGDFSSLAAPSAPKSTSTPSAMGDLFDLSAPSSGPIIQPVAASQSINSAFNLSSSAYLTKPPATAKAPAAAAFSSPFANLDAWGTTDAWNSPDDSKAAAASVPASTASLSTPKPISAVGDSGWGAPSAGGLKISSTPQVSADEDFGGWSSSIPSEPAKPAQQFSKPPPPAAPGSKPLGGFGGDDLFSNVWN